MAQVSVLDMESPKFYWNLLTAACVREPVHSARLMRTAADLSRIDKERPSGN
jgi:hypothetical protein